MAEVFKKEYKYKKLDSFLENEFIPRYIQMKRTKNSDNKIEVKPSIQLYNIVSLDYDEQTLKHVLEYLNHVGILVEGQDPKFFLENFEYIKDFKKNVSPKVFVNNDYAIFKQYLQNGEKKLRDEFIMKNIGLVKYIAYRFSRKTNLNMEEIESYGYEGLMQAINNYKADVNPNFGVFANTCIRNAIMNGIPKIYGFKAGDFYDNFKHSKIEIENLNGEKLEDNFSLIYDIVELMVKNVSKNYKWESRHKVGIKFHESLDDSKYHDLSENEPFELEIETENKYEYLMQALESLPFKEQEVLKYLYGFKDGKTHTLEEVGKIFGVTRERIRTIQANALKHMRHPKNSRHLLVPSSFNDNSLDSYNEQNITYGHKF